MRIVYPSCSESTKAELKTTEDRQKRTSKYPLKTTNLCFSAGYSFVSIVFEEFFGLTVQNKISFTGASAISS